MKDGFIKVGVVTPDLKVADTDFNGNEIIKWTQKLANQGVKLIVFPELCITGYTCNDLFLQDALLEGAEKTLLRIVEETEELDSVIVVGLPMTHNDRLYNVAAVIKSGEVLGLVPKSHIPGYSEFYESRHFAKGNEEVVTKKLGTVKQGSEELDEDDNEQWVDFGTKQLFACENLKGFVLGVEICEDLWMPAPPSSYHAMAGATVIANLSASDETTGKSEYRKELVKGQSARTISAYLYADAGEGESTTDLVFTGADFIVENGIVLAESKRFENGAIISEIDLQKLANERRRMTTYPVMADPEEKGGYVIQGFFFNDISKTTLTRQFEKTPFVPTAKGKRESRCDEILNIQAAGLKKRLAHTNCKTAVIGLSGGLDSTLALLVTVRAFDSLNIPREQIISVTMPCFGTTNRTYDNAVNLAKELGTTLKEVPIEDAVKLHFEHIEHDINVHDITYENGQARERTQILMDIANEKNGMVIGTGDMSELALGWATYNGDHMSMYGVNCSVPKTLVRFLVQYYADTCGNENLTAVLYDVLDTPVSPELLPPKDGEIAQKTEDIVGPYELHDFFLYYMMRFGFMPSKIYRMAEYTFAGDYDKETIYQWLTTFYRRFFGQQFKRSCLPDGPKVGSVALSPRGDWRMPSDACVTLWMKDLEHVKEQF